MKTIRQHLGYKLFFSYLIIIVVGVVTLALAAEVVTPSAFNRHMVNMGPMMGGQMEGMMADLTGSFQAAINEILLISALLAIVTAAVVSTFVTRRIVTPIEELKTASQRIASGRYDERVKVTGEDEMAEMARSFNQMAHVLAQTESRRRQLIGDVAHELRTPLSTLRGVMEGLIDGILAPDPATFNNVQRELSRLQRLVHDLEELSRAEAGEIPLEMAIITPEEIVSGAISRLALQFEDKGVALQTDIQAGLPAVAVDPSRMAQVLLNLLGNALQYTPAGGQVTVAASSDDQRLTITIADSGIGIPAEALAHIFERFFRVDKSRARTGGGSGVGLTISRHIVEAHQGTLTATSPGPGQGSTFILTLPLAR